jgi:glycosyltransferase involved in cell wall biosynthesis
MRLALSGSAARVILQNPDDVDLFLRAELVPNAQIRLIPGSGVNCDRFRAPAERTDDGWTAALKVVLAARMLWDKGIGEFVEAARRLRSEKRPVDFVLAGDPDPGNPAAIPEDTLREWQAEGVVRWLGHVDDMPSLLAAADIVVLPSYREGLPKTLIEAAACARPLVTCNVPGCRHVVRDGIDGLLVPPRDADALARAIARLQDDPQFAARLGQAARSRALNEFDERIVVAQTIAVYAELVGTFDPLAVPSLAPCGSAQQQGDRQP